MLTILQQMQRSGRDWKNGLSSLSRLLEILLHPEYNAERSWSYDVALIKLSDPADARFHWPACLPSQDADYTGQMGWMYGKTFPTGTFTV